MASRSLSNGTEEQLFVNFDFIYNSSPICRYSNRLRPSSPLSIPGNCGRFRQATSAEDILSISPSLRNARSLQEDMEMLRQSRQDNPYIQQQIEKFSVLSEGFSRFDGHSLHHQVRSFLYIYE